jgi:adenylate cyclase
MLATREFFERVKHRAEARVIDRVIVKGKSVPLELIEIRHKFSPENFQEIAKRYGEAFGLYREGKFERAEHLFSLLSELDKPSTVMAERCADLAAHPPEHWCGVFVFATK